MAPELPPFTPSLISIQMLEYNPKNCRYPGDDSMRVCTKQNKNKNTRGDGDPEDPCSNKRSRGRPSVVDKKKAVETAN